MIRGLSGSLLSHDALLRHRAFAKQDDFAAHAARGAMRRWHHALRSAFGPTAGARTVFDSVAAPLFSQLGYKTVPSGGKGPHVHGVLAAQGRIAAALLVTSWDADLTAAWREAIRHGISEKVRWCFCLNGTTLRVLDAVRSYSRRHAQFDLEVVVEDETTFRIFRNLLASTTTEGAWGHTPLDDAIALSERYRAGVRTSLQHGVYDALTHLLRAFAAASRRRNADVANTFEECLIVVYRVLFLLFAEARGLVPRWHPIYRESYTIESLRPAVEAQSRPRGLWDTLQAISRMAHRGCRAGSLRVPPFNGRLFSPAEAPLSDSLPLDDGTVRQALLALTTRKDAAGLQRIAYGDLGVEHLGGIYERLLDFQPARAGSAPALVRAERRKTTGSFYTPRSLTEYLVRRSLAPLVQHAAPDEVLSLRVLDPAMGSGAFLVAACRYLAAAYEHALLREGAIVPSDLGDGERADFRRTIAQRCLYGVDINPTAVQLGRLSLWLATLSADRPLTFLDHHLRCGNSLVGASVADLLRQPSAAPSVRRPLKLPLFAPEDIDPALASTVAPRLAIASEPGDTLEQVRAKERTLLQLTDAAAPLARWKAAADLWCAGWFSEARALRARGTFGALLDSVLRDCAQLPAHVAGPLQQEVLAAAVRVRFFHWTLEFPEIFFDAEARPLDNPGFHAVIGNAPWEMLRGDRGGPEERNSARTAASQLTAFARGAGIYRFQGNGHANLYQMFLERATALVRRGGRIAMVLPSGFASDSGCAELRRHLLDHSSVDTFVGVENRDGVFPIHRGLKFLLVTATTGASTAALDCRFGVRSPDVLDGLPDIGVGRETVRITRALIDRAAGADLAIPELRTAEDLNVFSAIAFSVPALGSAEGWRLRFGRELNATEDKHHFVRGRGGLPVVEGKQLRPFVVDVDASRFRIPAATAARLLDPQRTYLRPRLAYRDVASAANRLTLIAAVIPSGAVTTHTLFCLRDEPREEVHQFLCGVFNSYVANYLVRLRVGMHVTVSIVDRLPVPRPACDSEAFRDVVRCSARLMHEPNDRAASARLQALCARLYGLTRDQFQHVLASFPLVDAEERARAMAAFVASG